MSKQFVAAKEYNIPSGKNDQERKLLMTEEFLSLNLPSFPPGLKPGKFYLHNLPVLSWHASATSVVTIFDVGLDFSLRCLV